MPPSGGRSAPSPDPSPSALPHQPRGRGIASRRGQPLGGWGERLTAFCLVEAGWAGGTEAVSVSELASRFSTVAESAITCRDVEPSIAPGILGETVKSAEGPAQVERRWAIIERTSWCPMNGGPVLALLAHKGLSRNRTRPRDGCQQGPGQCSSSRALRSGRSGGEATLAGRMQREGKR